TLLTSVDANPAGLPEIIATFMLPQPGTYYVRVGGNASTVQLYSLAVTPTALSLPGDYNHDNVVDALDYVVWRDNYGSTTRLAADGSGNSVVDIADYAVWLHHFGQSEGSGGQGLALVPEPTGAFACITGFAAIVGFRLRKMTRASLNSLHSAQP